MRKLIALCAGILGITTMLLSLSMAQDNVTKTGKNSDPPAGTLDPLPPNFPAGMTVSLTGKLANHYIWDENMDGEFMWFYTHQYMMPTLTVDAGNNWANAEITLKFFSKSDTDMTTALQGQFTMTLDANGDGTFSLPNPDDPLLKGAWRSVHPGELARWRYCNELGFLRCQLSEGGLVFWDTDWKMFSVEDDYDN